MRNARNYCCNGAAKTYAGTAAALTAVLWGAVAAAAEEAPARPSRPMLEQLNQECKELYHGLQGGLLRVQMPPPKWVSDLARRERDDRFGKYNIDDNVKRELLERQTRRVNAVPSEAQEPATQPAAGASNQGVLIVVTPVSAPEGTREVLGGRMEMPRNPRAGNNAGFAPNNVGLLLDEQGHVLVPLYVEREELADQPIRLTRPDGELTTARFVGSDQQTNLTVLKLGKGPASRPSARPSATPDPQPGKPVRLSTRKLEDGALVLYVATGDGSGRLGLWNGGTGGVSQVPTPRDFGIVVGIDGEVLGISRYGQFLSGSACQLIVNHLIRYGAVKRATLGVILAELEKDDALRQQQPSLLGDRPAVRVNQVMKGSPADKAGLRQGDLLLALAGDPDAVKNVPTIAASIAAKNGPTPLRVLRGGEVIEVTVDLQQK
jgi:S1-C subfamily serine protease